MQAGGSKYRRSPDASFRRAEVFDLTGCNPAFDRLGEGLIAENHFVRVPQEC
jgi:hypothetical protein